MFHMILSIPKNCPGLLVFIGHLRLFIFFVVVVCLSVCLLETKMEGDDRVF